MPVSSCSAPIGRCTATHLSESCAFSASRALKKSARSRSSMFTNTTRERPASSARCQWRLVWTSTPITALTVKRAPSTTRSAAIASPWNPASPGVSIRLILRPCHSRWATDAERDIWRRCSSSSQSLTVDPDSTVPRRFVAPDWKSSASTSDVFPVPRCPTTATLRIFPGSAPMRWLPPCDAVCAGDAIAAVQVSSEARVVDPESRAFRRRIAFVWSWETRDSVTPRTSPISRRVSSS